MVPFRVLVVEDFEPFRRLIVSTLRERPELQTICELSDGLEGVRKAQELQPDLIVLDIGLPTLNGIEAARRIRELSPESKIVFLSQISDADVMREALDLGALGYVVKTHAGSELLPAVDAVLQGNQFTGRGLSGQRTAAGTADGLRQEEGFDLPSPRKGATPRHEVCFYTDDASFLRSLTGFIESTLEAGNAVIVVATASHQKSFLQCLQADGVDSAAAIKQGRYIPLDAADTLSSFMVNDLPDPVRFSRVVNDLLESAAKAAKGEQPRIAVCGEGAPLLWAQGKADGAVQLEHLWDEVTKIYDLDVQCGYVLESAQRETEDDVYGRICAEHSSVSSQRKF